MSEGQAILVTGAGRGIGRAIARLAATRGWSVGVNYLHDERAAHAVVEEIARGGGKAVALRGDVADQGDVAAIFDGAERALGPLRGVVRQRRDRRAGGAARGHERRADAPECSRSTSSASI